MKKFMTIVAIATTLIISSAAVAHVTGNTFEGTVRFESSEMPALNFTMPVSRAADIFNLMPESVTTVCRQKYAAVRAECARAGRFSHEGVSVQRTGADPAMEFVFTVPGYKLTVSNVSWRMLDAMFGLGNE